MTKGCVAPHINTDFYTRCLQLSAGLDNWMFCSCIMVLGAASYYVLFAAMAGQAYLKEPFVAVLFSGVAIAGTFRWPVIVGIGIVLHGFLTFHTT